MIIIIFLAQYFCTVNSYAASPLYWQTRVGLVNRQMQAGSLLFLTDIAPHESIIGEARDDEQRGAGMSKMCWEQGERVDGGATADLRRRETHLS